MPLRQRVGGAVHVGALDAMAGLPFRVVAIPGLVEGGYPGVIRPDPFLLDEERAALGSPAPGSPRPARAGQLSLFDEEGAPQVEPGTANRASTAHVAGPPARSPAPLPSGRVPGHGAAHPLLPPRRPSHGPRTAAVALLRRGGRSARGAHPWPRRARAPGARGRPHGAPPRGRPGRGGTGPDPRAARRRGGGPGHRRRLALLQAVSPRQQGTLGRPPLGLRRLPGPAARRALPGAGSRLGDVADLRQPPRPLRHLRLQVHARERAAPGAGAGARGAPASRAHRAREPLPRRGGALSAGAARAGASFRCGTPWRCGSGCGSSETRPWTAWCRAARRASRCSGSGSARGSTRPSSRGWSGRPRPRARSRRTSRCPSASTGRLRPASPSRRSPFVIELGDGRTLRVSGKIDRIDRREDGSLVLRDYKTGRAPKDDGGTFRGGRQLQIPFYILAARRSSGPDDR